MMQPDMSNHPSNHKPTPKEPTMPDTTTTTDTTTDTDTGYFAMPSPRIYVKELLARIGEMKLPAAATKNGAYYVAHYADNKRPTIQMLNDGLRVTSRPQWSAQVDHPDHVAMIGAAGLAKVKKLKPEWITLLALETPADAPINVHQAPQVQVTTDSGVTFTSHTHPGTGNGVHHIDQYRNPDERTQTDPAPHLYDIPRGYWQQMGGVVDATSTDDSRPILTGMLFQARQEDNGPHTFTMVGTDSYRLAAAEIRQEQPHSPPAAPLDGWIIDRKMLAPAAKAYEAYNKTKATIVRPLIYLWEREARLDVGPISYEARTIEGTYPSWRGLIPEDGAPYDIPVDGPDIAAAIKTWSAMKDGGNEGSPLLFAEGYAVFDEVSTPTPNITNLPTEGVQFNPGYFVASAQGLPAGTRAYGHDSLRPWLAVAEIVGVTVSRLVMPVRVSR